MITRYPYANLGYANHGWLEARHHFSFAEYRNRERMHFGALRVINDDIIAAGQGFGKHPHADMEIITYVREGSITHQDSLGNEGCTQAGDVQVMSAGSGVLHAEHNLGTVPTRLYQIWIVPNQQSVTPRWETRVFPKEPVHANGRLPLLVSGRDEDRDQSALWIYQDAAIYGGKLLAGTRVQQPIKYQAYVLASKGRFLIDDVWLQAGDGAEISDQVQVTLMAETDCEILVIDVPSL